MLQNKERTAINIEQWKLDEAKPAGKMQRLRLPVLRLPGVALHIQQLIDDLRSLQVLPNQEKQRHHASHLQRKGDRCIFVKRKPSKQYEDEEDVEA